MKKQTFGSTLFRVCLSSECIYSPGMYNYCNIFAVFFMICVINLFRLDSLKKEEQQIEQEVTDAQRRLDEKRELISQIERDLKPL